MKTLNESRNDCINAYSFPCVEVRTGNQIIAGVVLGWKKEFPVVMIKLHGVRAKYEFSWAALSRYYTDQISAVRI